MRIRSLHHSTYKHLYHLVWGTKFRYEWLKPYVITELEEVFQEICTKYPTLSILTWKADGDHIHLQMEIPPNITVSEAVKQLKSRSSQRLRKKFKFIREMYIDDEGIWSVGYFSSTIGLNEELIRKYIEHQ